MAPDADDTADRTIRNQRYEGLRAWVWLAGWFLAWLPAGYMIESEAPREWRTPLALVTGLCVVTSFFLIVAHLDRRPVLRLRLGDELRAYPSGRLTPADIRAVRFAVDERAEYADGPRPVPLCEVAVEGRGGRRFRLVASAGDAARLRERAERHGIAVLDPHGFTALGSRGRPE